MIALGKRVRVCFAVLDGDTFAVPEPLRTTKSLPSAERTLFQYRNTGSRLRWQLTAHTVLPSTIGILGSMQVPTQSPRPLCTHCAT